ncbi:MAG: holo-ACP synthase [Pseudomonadota bacterium]
MTMTFDPDPAVALCARASPGGVRLGFDLVQVSQIAESICAFGSRFTDRFFTMGELQYSQRGSRDERLAARFAAKEAVIKALALSEAGIDWREIEVVQLPQGGCELALHGRVAQLAAARGVTDRALSLSLSHDGDYAGAVVCALTVQAQEARNTSDGFDHHEQPHP